MIKTKAQILQEDMDNKVNRILETEISAEFHEFMANKQKTDKEKAQFLVNRDAQRTLKKQLEESLKLSKEFSATFDK